MGCSDSQEQDFRLKNIERVFDELGLSLLVEDIQFEHLLEQHIFMAINVCRVKPQLFIPIVNHLKLTHPLAKKYKHTKELVKVLKSLGSL